MRLSHFAMKKGKQVLFADNSHKKWSEERHIYKPSDILTKTKRPLWIIASEFHSLQIVEQLKEMGITDSDVVLDITGIMKRKTEDDRQRRLTPQKHLKLLTIYIYDGCNLNCAGCNIFIPLCSKPAWMVGIDEFRRDVKRLSELFGNSIEILELMGGEPLMHPKLDELISIVRQYFSSVIIRIVSNGLLLPRMSESFWESCRQNEALVSVTPYPVTLDLERINNLAEEKQAKVEFFGIATEKTSWHFAYDPTGGQHPTESFGLCWMANDCVSMKQGRISTCPVIPYANYFSDYFKKDMYAANDDSIDIYKAQSAQEIFDFIAKPVSFCRFCDVKHRTYDNPWQISKRDICEWVLLNE